MMSLDVVGVNGVVDSGSTNAVDLERVEKRNEIAQQFEALFVSLMLKEMRQSVSEDGLFAGDSSDTFGGMFDMFMGQHIASTGGIGLSKIFDELDLTDDQSLNVATAAASKLTNKALEAYQHASTVSSQ